MKSKNTNLIRLLLILFTLSISAASHAQNKVNATIILNNQQKVSLSVLNMRYDNGMTVDDNNFLILKDDSDNWIQIPFKNITHIIPIKSGKRILKYKVTMKSGATKEGYDGRGYRWVCGPDIDEIFVMYRLSEVNRIIIGNSVQ